MMIELEPEERRKRLAAVQARLQVLWDRAEATADDFQRELLWAEFRQLELQERELLRPGTRRRVK